MVAAAVKERLRGSPPYQAGRAKLAAEGRVGFRGVAGSLCAALAVSLAEDEGRPLVYIAVNDEEAAWLREDLGVFLGDRQGVLFFPESESLSRLSVGTSATVNRYRAEALQALSRGEVRALVVSARAMAEKLLLPRRLLRQVLEFHVGEVVDFETLPELLTEMGYLREDLVERPGEFSVRGGILDVYSPHAPLPVRLEFFGDQVESIREFRPEDQRSLRQLNKALIFPPAAASPASTPERAATLLDYLPEKALIVLDEPARIREEMRKAREKSLERLDRGASPSYEDPERIFEMMGLFSVASIYSLYGEEDPVVDLGSRRQETLGGNFRALAEAFDRLRASSANPLILFACESRSHRDRMLTILEEQEIDLRCVHVVELPIQRGFICPQAGLHVLTTHEFYGRERRPLPAKPLVPFSPLRRLRSLNKGDYVVHADYGIGRFEGLQKIRVAGAERECVVLTYEGGDRVYVPLERMDRIEKYSSREGVQPKLSRLGSVEWERLKARAKDRVKEIARELIRINAERKLRPGHAFSPDGPLQHELEASFPYEETPDQAKAIEEVKRDMESPQPMDRLVCGDAGYGKTEVALRAAFKAVADGKQVAILVPTTVLAEQHYETFRTRLEPFPVNVEVLSRFRSPREQRDILRRLAEGKVDIVIGTHRLLSNDVRFKDLGLLIIDEEQHFGVRQKEKLKKLKVTVDVLSMSATPIPRTLHMALVGARDLSVINTPPRDRLPIHTEVLPFNKEVIRKAILREVDRGGQVFFVHNRVRSIQAMVGMLRRLVPEVDFGMAHGEMPERELERVMRDFLDRKFHCLVSTVIIESGLDMPNVNTLIVNRADRFGLAQLYQLRGRVGRSNVKAYAYLLTPPIETLTKEAIERLRALAELTELGSGFQIALRDLEIRGAGNLLGPEQSGFIDALGFEMYCRIIDQAVRELRAEMGQEPVLVPASEIETRVETDVDAFLPEQYVPLADERVEFYRRLIRATDVREVDEIREELEDRFGKLPPPARHLLDYVRIKILGSRLGLSKIELRGSSLVGWYDTDRAATSTEWMTRLRKLLQQNDYPIELVGTDAVGFRIELRNGRSRTEEAVDLLTRMAT
ncbi:MAG: transcription-repair coupling factor [candidate division KSB1 bacterium]|nr:transcription-repair coupling factor [candidate division KSB1 bacterium]